MRKIALTLLTTLFVSVMTLQASYAQDVPAGDCATVETLRAAIGETVKERGGSFEAITDKEVIQRWIDTAIGLGASPPPWQITAIAVVKTTSVAEGFSVGYFSDGGCYVGKVRLPEEVVEKLLGRVKG